MSHIETLMRNSASTYNGWMKTTTKNNEILRSISIGNQRNCNGDGLFCDHTTESKIIEIMKKYDVLEYKLNNIHTPNVFATHVLIDENTYVKLVSKLNSN